MDPTQADGVMGISRKKAFMKTVNALGSTIGTQKMAIFFLRTSRPSPAVAVLAEGRKPEAWQEWCQACEE